MGVRVEVNKIERGILKDIEEEEGYMVEKKVGKQRNIKREHRSLS